MKHTLFLLALSGLASSTACAAVGDTVNTSKYTADGVNCFVYNDSVSVLLASTRFYDSAKQVYYSSSSPDSLMCWAHSSANSIQYWQTYYGVFAKDSIPYGSREGTSAWSDKVTDLQVADTMRQYFKNVGEDFATATKWYMSGVITEDMVNSMKIVDGGGYFEEYYDSTQPYTKYDVKNAELGTLTNAIFQAFGLEKNGNSYIQAEAGLIPLVGIAYQNAEGYEYGHSISCYAFTTDSNGNIDTLYLTDPDKVDGKMDLAYVGKDSDGRLVLYSDASRSTPLPYDTKGNTWYIRNVWHLNTPEVLQDMLAEYSDVENEAQVWNGGSSVWSIQESTTEELPTEATGWDVHVNGESITAQGHAGYYHTYSTDGRDVIFDNHAQSNRNVTISGIVSARNITIDAQGYAFTAADSASGIAAGANLILTSQASLDSSVKLTLANLTLTEGAELISQETITVDGDFRTLRAIQQAATYALNNVAMAATEASDTVTNPLIRLQADLDLTQADSILLESAVDMQQKNLAFSLGQEITLAFHNEGSDLPFFLNVGSITIGGTTYQAGDDIQHLLNIKLDGNPADYRFTYTQDGTLTLTIPEPSGSLLSLLALATMSIRRRRK